MTPHYQNHNLRPRSGPPYYEHTQIPQGLYSSFSTNFNSESSMSSSSSSNPAVQSRRSHRKSRNGCKTCKKRHIRCDETPKQCRNCTKHNVRCDYMDGVPAEGVPDLKITPQIEHELDAWKNYGVYPFPQLAESHLSPSRYSATDLRLIHHISSIASQMQAADSSSRYASWTKRVPMFLKIASTNDFVMHSLLGLSASHLSWLTASFATMQLAYQHRGLAFQGLQQAIGNFSKENSDAVLAASILLSWQVTDWRSWASLLQGTSAVITAMQAWKYESVFAEFMEETEIFSSGPVRQQIFDPGRDRHVVAHVYNCLMPLVPYFTGKGDETKGLEALIYFIGELQEHIPVNSAEEQFEILHPLRAWLFFLPIDFLKRGRHDVSAMVLLAHFFGVALAIEPLFPAVGAAYFGTMSVGPIEHIHSNLRDLVQTTHSREAHTALSLMAFPLEMVHQFRQRMNWRRLDQVHHPVSPRYSHQQPGGYDFQAFPEYTMMSGRDSPMYQPPPAQDVHRSFAASDFIASAMWKTS